MKQHLGFVRNRNVIQVCLPVFGETISEHWKKTKLQDLIAFTGFLF